MKTLFDIPIIETPAVGDNVYLLPPVRPVVYIPPHGFTFEERLVAEQRAVTEAYTQAAKRGEVGVITGLTEE